MAEQERDKQILTNREVEELGARFLVRFWSEKDAAYLVGASATGGGGRASVRLANSGVKSASFSKLSGFVEALKKAMKSASIGGIHPC